MFQQMNQVTFIICIFDLSSFLNWGFILGMILLANNFGLLGPFGQHWWAEHNSVSYQNYYLPRFIWFLIKIILMFALDLKIVSWSKHSVQKQILNSMVVLDPRAECIFSLSIQSLIRSKCKKFIDNSKRLQRFRDAQNKHLT